MSHEVNVELLNRAATLEPGEQILLRCASPQEMEATRISLRRTKEALLKANPVFESLGISRVSSRKKNKFLIIIFRKTGLSEATIVKADGTEESLILECGSKEKAAEMERICKLMEEDGATREEIETFLKGYQEQEE